MEFLVEFEVEVPAGTPDAEVEHHQRAESAAAAQLAEDGHLVRLWRRPLAGDGTTAIGLYRAGSMVTEVEGASHFLMMSQPDIVAGVIREAVIASAVNRAA